MNQTQAGQLQILPDPHTDFVFSMAGSGWGLALALVAISALAAGLFWWRRRRGPRN